MNLRAIGCNVESAPVEFREKLAFDSAKLARALAELQARYGAEAAILGTCNRVELYLARAETSSPIHSPLVAEFLSEIHDVPVDRIRPHLYELADAEAVRHLFRVACGLNSVVLGEGQIAGQVKDAYEAAQKAGATGTLLNVLFPAANRVSKRVRSETKIAEGHVSVPSAAIDHLPPRLQLVHGQDGAGGWRGKDGPLDVESHPRAQPLRLLVTNRNPERAVATAADCGGQAHPWEHLDDLLVQADIVLSTTGAPEPIVPRRRFDEKVRGKRGSRTLVVFDLAVPRETSTRACTMATAWSSSTWTTSRARRNSGRRNAASTSRRRRRSSPPRWRSSCRTGTAARTAP